MSRFNRSKLSQLPGIKQLLWTMLPNGVYCFNYHRIGVAKDSSFDPNVFSCTPEVFEQHLIFFKKNFEIISIEQLNQLYMSPQLDKKYALITFDDGYQDNYERAFPLLKKYQVPATLFVATDFIDQKCIPWWDEVAWIIRQCTTKEIAATGWLSTEQLDALSLSDRIKAILRVIKKDQLTSIDDKLTRLRQLTQKSCDITDLPQKLFANWDMIREMSTNGISIGSHTCSHRILSHLSKAEQKHELLHSKEKIERELNQTISALAYPVGGIDSFNNTTENLAQASGYSIAFSYINGINKTLTNDFKYQLLRIPVDNNPIEKKLIASIVSAANLVGVEKSQNHVIVLAAGPNGLGVIRSLHIENTAVITVNTSKKDISNFSRIPREKHTIQGRTDKERQQWLLAFLQRQPRNTTIIPTSDWFVSFLTEHTQALEQNCLFLLPAKEVTELLIDKALETKVIGEVVPIPKTIQTIVDKQQLVSELEMPIIIKPRSHKHMVLGQKNIVIQNSNDADNFFAHFSDKLKHLIAQQVILGADDLQWVCNCVFDLDSNMVQGFTFNRLKLSPSHYGVTSYARSEHNQEILALSKKVGKSIKFIGPAMLEFKQDPIDGKYKYIELNPRLGMCNFFDTSCGINNAYATYLLAAGRIVSKNSPMQSNKVFLSFFEDFFSRKQDGETTLSIFKDYLSKFTKQHVFIYYVWWDPYPAIHLAATQVGQFIKSSYKKITLRQ